MKFTIFILIAAMVFTAVCSCDSAVADTTEPAGKASETMSDTTSEKSVTTAENTETAAIETEAPFSENKKILWNGEIVPDSRDWSTTQFGIVNPELSETDKGTDIGQGYAFTLRDGSSCQFLTYKAEATGELPYFRIWINNKTSGTVEIGIQLCGGGKNAVLSAENAQAYTADGKDIDCDKTDASGMGSGIFSSVKIPSGFYGWVTFNTDEMIPYWGEEMPDSVSFCDTVCIDMRPVGFADGEYYILDEMCQSASPYGQPREYTDAVKANTAEKIAMIQNTYSELLKKVPEYTEIPKYMPTGEFSGIKAITYDSVDRNGSKTKAFAYLAYPENANGKTPGIVLIHGGGGHAFLQWVKMWVDRGYAVIAPDVTGYFPTAKNAGKTETNADWKYGLHGVFSASGYTNTPNNDGMSSSAGAVENQWMYHALAQAIIADSILINSPSVDKDKVGVTGISWGGVITSLLIGYDTRLAFAIPIYGSGYLEQALSWIKDNFSGIETQALWSAADRFSEVKMPVLWLCWNDDSCFSVNSVSKSFIDTVKNNSNTRMSAINGMMHSHGCGWVRGESEAFADSVVFNGEKLPEFVTQPIPGSVSCEIKSSETVTATLYYISSPMSYSRHQKYGYTDTFMDQTWKTKKLKVENNTVTGSMPSGAVQYYIELKTAKGLVVTSTFITNVTD